MNERAPSKATARRSARFGAKGWYLAVAVVAGMLVLLTATALGRIATAHSNESRRLAEQSVMVAIVSDQVRDLIVDAQSAQRGYLLTGEDTYLEFYRSATRSLPPALDELVELTAGDPQNGGLVRELKALSS
ncbi:MAG: hypothetical protein QOE40_1467, partial [Actinomycetota bacterium]|nr:hypothetical protein [Actinomycetota bacterium]